MPITTLKVLASLIQLHGPGATIQSDHQGIDALLNDLRGQSAEQSVVSDEPAATQAAFRRGKLALRLESMWLSTSSSSAAVYFV